MIRPSPSRARRAAFAAALALSFAGPAAAEGGLAVSQGWTRPTAVGATAAGYLRIANLGPAPDRLVGAESPAASRVSLHQSAMSGSVMTMRPLASLAIAPGGVAVLAPGGVHLMLEGLKAPLTIGARAPVTLLFSRAGRVKTSLEVRLAAPPEVAR